MLWADFEAVLEVDWAAAGPKGGRKLLREVAWADNLGRESEGEGRES